MLTTGINFIYDTIWIHNAMIFNFLHENKYYLQQNYCIEMGNSLRYGIYTDLCCALFCHDNNMNLHALDPFDLLTHFLFGCVPANLLHVSKFYWYQTITCKAKYKSFSKKISVYLR